MSKLEIGSNLFLGVPEITRIQRFLGDEGFRANMLANTQEFGIIEGVSFQNVPSISKSDSFNVSKAGTPNDEVIINRGAAFDSNANLIYNRENFNLSIPNDNNWYWVRISYRSDSEEVGSVSIDQLGNLTGVGTLFTQTLRGQPNYPSKIRLLNSSNGNSDEYEVVRVVSDTSCILSGDFNAESTLKYSVIGTFTPGYVVPTNNKNIFRYDSVDIVLVQELVLNEVPTSVVDREFFIARVRNNGTDVTVEDKRVNFWLTNSSNYVRNLDRVANNPLIGVESVKYDIPTSTRESNYINVGFGFRFESYTIDTSSKKISILIGNGGKFKDTSSFQAGDFDGWRLYNSEGSWREIVDSQKTGTQIVVELDVLNPGDYSPSSGDNLMISPPYEDVEIRVRKDSSILDTEDTDEDLDVSEPLPFPSLERIYSFSINTEVAEIPVRVFSSAYNYNLTYRYKLLNDYTAWKVFPNDPIGFFNEDSFNENGNLNPQILDRTLVPYTGHISNGFITVTPNALSFQAFKDTVLTGDLSGVNSLALSNTVPLRTLEIGADKRYQHYTGGDIELTSNIFINLRRTKSDGTFYREGNEFVIHLDQNINLSIFNLRIVQNYVDPTNFESLVSIDANDAAYIMNTAKTGERYGIIIRCTYDDTNNWICHYDTETAPIGMIRMLKEVDASAFNGSGDGIIKGLFGWRLLDLTDVFPMSTPLASESGDEGSSNNRSLDITNIPPHQHTYVVQDNNYSDRYGTGTIIGPGGTAAQSGESDYTTPTDFAGGALGAAAGFDIKPKYMKFVWIEKIV